jgi:uncharacterized membrane protein YecN with MAPEG domain
MIPTITPLYAGLLGLIYVGLSLRIPRLRMKHRIGIGDGGNPELARAVRVHGNFAEYVPLCLILLLLVEWQGYSAWFVHAMGLMLLLARCLHAWGLGQSAGTSPGRFLGTVMTISVLVLTSGLTLLAALLPLFE